MSSLRSAAHRALLLPVLAACLAAPPLDAQSAAAEPAPVAGDQGSREAWELPRTAWGDPDLRGTWSYASLTPLERPGQFRDREFFTPEEASARNEAAHAERPHVPGVIGSYNAHWFDKGRVDPSSRTSLIVDPPSGRLPPLTPEGKARAQAKAQRFSGRPDSWLNFKAWTRCITYHGVPPVSTGYKQHLFDRPNAELRGDPGREHPRRTHHPARRAAAPRRTHSPVERGFTRSLGGRHAGGGDWQLQRQDGTSVPVVEGPCERWETLHTGRGKTRSSTNSASTILQPIRSLGAPCGLCRS